MMNLEINSKQSLDEIKNQFHELLPFMKIEFFHHGHDSGEGSPKDDMIAGDKKVGDFLTDHDFGSIEFDMQTKVFELEKKLKDYFGLNVQVFRKSGNLFLESTISDEWTLDRVRQEAIEFES